LAAAAQQLQTPQITQLLGPPEVIQYFPLLHQRVVAAVLLGILLVKQVDQEVVEMEVMPQQEVQVTPHLPVHLKEIPEQVALSHTPAAVAVDQEARLAQVCQEPIQQAAQAVLEPLHQ